METIVKDKGFIRIGDWHLTGHGRLDISYPSSISDVSGVISVLVNNEPMLFSSTSHYGPRIKDFKHSITGNKTSARIHLNIIEALEANKTVSLWVKNSTSPSSDKGALLRTFRPPWNL
jgi:hypothetical protein